MSHRLSALAALALVAACGGGRSGGYGCGLTAVTGQSLLLDQFNQPGTTLSAAPSAVPAILPVRIALGPAFRAVTGRADSNLIVGVEGTLPAKPVLGFGVLVVSPSGAAEGVLLYEGGPINGAPLLGSVNMGAKNLPLIGLQADISRFQEAACPIFPDSLRR